MGLDIYHHKAMLNKPTVFNPHQGYYMTKEKFEYFDVDLQYFEAYIQKIEIPISLQTLIFPKEKKNIEEIKKRFAGSNNKIMFEKNLDDIDLAIGCFMQQEGLTDNLFCKWDTGVNGWIGVDIFTFKEGYGFYYEQVGYQRKGMWGDFWKRFDIENIYNFTKKEDFDFALSCVDYYWHEDTEEDVILRKQLFKRDFVDKYEAHKSWLYLSY